MGSAWENTGAFANQKLKFGLRTVNILNLSTQNREAYGMMLEESRKRLLTSKTPVIHIERITEAQDIKEFLKFGWEVYRNNRFWVPPILQDTQKFLEGKTLFSKHCEHRIFVAQESGKTVAQAVAFYDQNLVKAFVKPVGMIGFFEALPDKEPAVKALFEQAEQYLQEKGAEVVWGPMNGGIANPVGLLANAYNQKPVFLMTYNPSYYHQYFRRLGYYPIKELIAYSMDMMDGKMQRKIRFILNRAKKSNITIRPLNRKRFKEECSTLSHMYDQTFKSHWGYAPQSEEEFYEIVSPLKLAIDPDFILFAESEGKPIGFTMAVPDYNPAIKRLNGNLNLVGSLAFLRLKKEIHEARLIAIGVSPEWRGKRVAVLLTAAVYDAMIKKGYTKCEYSWVFRENISSQNVARKIDDDDYRHYLVYERNLLNGKGKRFLK